MRKTILSLLLCLTAVTNGCGNNIDALIESDRLFAEGVELYNEGNYAEAIPLFEQSDKIDKKQLDKGSNRRDYSAMWVASCYHRLGNDEEAKKWDPLFYNQDPIDRRLTVESDAKELLAGTYYAMGQYNEALDCLLEGAAIEKEVLGEDSYFYATSLYMISQCCLMLNDFNNGYPISLQACSQRIKTLGINHPYTAMSLSDVATYESLSGNHANAVKYETLAMEAFGEYYGKESYEYLTSLTSLSFYYNLLGDNDTAIRLQNEALEITGKAYGMKSAEYAEGLNNLARYYSYAGDYAGAVDAGEQALKIYEKTYGRNSAECADLMGDLAGYYSDAGDLRTAMQTQTKATEIFEKLQDKDPENYASSLISLSVYCLEYGDFSKCIDLNVKAMEIFENSTGSQNIMYSGALRSIATCYFALEDYTEAIRFNEMALNFNREAIGGSDAFTAPILADLAYSYAALGNYGEAIRLAQEGLEINERLSGKEHPDYAAALSSLAEIYDLASDPVEAVRIEEQAQKIIADSFGTDHLRYADSLKDLARYYSNAGDPAKAVEICTESARIFGRIFGESSADYAGALSELAMYYSLCGDIEKAIQLQTSALEIHEKVHGRQHLAYCIALFGLAGDKAMAGDHETAITLAQEAADIIKENYGELNENYVSITNFLAYESFIASDWLKTVEYAAKSSVTLYAIIASKFSGLTANERSLFWDKHREWFEVRMPSFTFSIPTDEMKALEYDTILMSKGLLLNSETELGKLLLESGDENAVSKYRALQQNRTILGKLYEQPVSERRMNADSLENVVKKQEQELLKLSKTYGDYTKNLSVSWNRVQEGLGEKDVAIEFLDIQTDTEHAYVALTLTKEDNVPGLAYLFDEKDLDGIKNTDFYTTPAVSALVWKPLSEVLAGKENVYFSPSGELYNIAIESLPDYEGDGLISDRLNFYRLSSTRQLALDQDKAELKRADIYGGLAYSTDTETLVNDYVKYGGKRSVDFGTVDADSLGLRGGVEELPKAKEEAEKIYDIVGNTTIAGNIYTDTLGTETSLKSLSGKNTNILHIATHGFFWTESEAMERKNLSFLGGIGTDTRNMNLEDRSMTRTGLLFAGANIALKGGKLPQGVDDGVLTAKEISVLDLRGLDLVVLSACQTGLGEITGDGVFGLQRGFKKAGANSLLMSLWKVEDQATQLFMTHFYYDLLYEKMTKRASFLDSQDFLRKAENGKFDKPECWAAFILLDALD